MDLVFINMLCTCLSLLWRAWQFDHIFSQKLCIVFLSALHSILASNTSTIDLNLISAKTHVQDRIVGAHFFSPAHVMPLLEIVRTEKTSPQIIVDLINVGKNIKKVPRVVTNYTGFVVNQMFFPYTQSDHILAILGVDIYRIDKVITSFGMLMPPSYLQNGPIISWWRFGILLA